MEKGGFRVPDDARALIEGVFGEMAEESIPDGLLERSMEAVGQNWANIGVAELNALNLDEGYSASSSNRWWDEARTPTRLGEPTITVHLARWDGDRLQPWVEGSEQAWQRSAVQIRTAHIAEEADVEKPLQAAVVSCREQLPAEGKWSVLLPLAHVDASVWQGRVKNEKGKTVTVYYSSELGLMMKEEMLRLTEEGSL